MSFIRRTEGAAPPVAGPCHRGQRAAKTIADTPQNEFGTTLNSAGRFRKSPGPKHILPVRYQAAINDWAALRIRRACSRTRCGACNEHCRFAPQVRHFSAASLADQASLPVERVLARARQREKQQPAHDADILVEIDHAPVLLDAGHGPVTMEELRYERPVDSRVPC
jgi:hypothetical protein